MKKIFLSFIILSLSYAQTEAQSQNIYYLKNNGKLVSTRDSADYVRVVGEPETGSELYTVKEFYASGKKMSLGHSSEIEPLKYEGVKVSFYPNGKRQQIATYAGGVLIDSCFSYYPNGELYSVLAYPNQGNIVPAAENMLIYTIHAVNDSSGKALVVDGNGPCVFYEPDFTKIREKGLVKNGKKDSLWTGYDGTMGITYQEIYDQGKLVSGETSIKGRTVSRYTSTITPATYKTGMDAFYKYVSNSMIYPSLSIRKHIQGKVVLKFTVEKDGSLTGITVVSQADPSLAYEAIRVLNKSGKWTPGTARGVTVRMVETLPFNFTLDHKYY